MNFLAHLYLSPNHTDVMIGNFLGDFVKGAQVKQFPEKITEGIILHRFIDDFTDQHAVVLESKKVFRKNYRHYAPVIVDVLYDHFLALHWQQFHSMPLKHFTESFYQATAHYEQYFSQKVKSLLFYMSRDDWLYNYRYLEGIEQALSGLARRTSFDSGMEHAIADIKSNYQLLETQFQTFFPAIRQATHNFIQEKYD